MAAAPAMAIATTSPGPTNTTASSSSTSVPCTPLAPTAAVQAWLSALDDALQRRDVAAAVSLFDEQECFWRDLVAFTWNIYTAEGRAQVAAMLEATAGAAGASGWEVDGEATVTATAAGEEKGPDGAAAAGMPVGGTLDALVRFRTAAGRARGHVRLCRRRSEGGGEELRCWTMMTALWELEGGEHRVGEARAAGVVYGPVRGRRAWREQSAARRAEQLRRRLLAAASGGDQSGGGAAAGGNKEEEAAETEQQPYCVVVGGGQAGVALGARLRVLGVPCVVVEKNSRLGDSWRHRYACLRLHTPVWTDHLPYLRFPDSWPVFPSKDEMGDWLDAYAAAMDVPLWCSAEAVAARYVADDDLGAPRWEVDVKLQTAATAEGSKTTTTTTIVTLRPAHLVLATGAWSTPQLPPPVPGADTFLGAQIHSSQYVSGAEHAGKHALVVGSNTSAHDICADLWEQGAASVTMLQRSATIVVRSATLYGGVPVAGDDDDDDVTGVSNDSNRAAPSSARPPYTCCYGFPGLYGDAPALTTPAALDAADLLLWSVPHALLPRLQRPFARSLAARDARFYARLAAAGFHADFGPDGAGVLPTFYRRGAGYYVDTGASELIASGAVRVLSSSGAAGGGIARLGPRAAHLADGAVLPADLLVYATGYAAPPDRPASAGFLPPAVAAAVGRCRGLGSGLDPRDPGPWEGEQRNMWKPTRQPGLWFHGGAVQENRAYSLVLALQIQARFLGKPTPVYGMPLPPPSAAE